jgi:hypothetical protein
MLVLLMEWIYKICRWIGLRWHDINTKSHDDRFRHSSNIKGIASTIWGAVMLVRLMLGIYEVCFWDGLRWYDTRIGTKFHDDQFSHSSNIKVLLQRFEGLWCWYYWCEGFIKYAVEMDWGTIMYIPSIIKVDSGIQKFFGGNIHTGAQTQKE